MLYTDAALTTIEDWAHGVVGGVSLVMHTDNMTDE